METYKLRNGQKVKDGDWVQTIENGSRKPTKYKVRFEYGEWVIKYLGNFPDTHSLPNHAHDLELSTPS